LDAATNRYSLGFPPGQLPPVNAFWSLAMPKPDAYEGKWTKPPLERVH